MNIFKRQKNKILDYKQTFGTESGKRVLAELVQYAELRSSFNKDPYLTAFKEGERNLVLRIMSFIDCDVEKLNESIKQNRGDSDEYPNDN